MRISVILFCAAFIALCFANPDAFVSAGTSGLKMIYNAVLPVLFPFFIISTLIINMLPPSGRHTVISAALLSFLSGYPNGARLVSALYTGGAIDKQTAKNLCVWTSTPSPIFVVVSVGTVMLRNTLLGFLIFISAVFGAILNGLLWQRRVCRRHKVTTVLRLAPKQPPENFLKIFNSAMTSAVNAILNVCGIILISYIAVSVLAAPPPLSGIIEMTTGAARISALPYAPKFAAIFICFVVSFGGLSVAMQNFIFMREFNMPPLYYFLQKTTHAILSAAILSAILLLY